jgi:hypothetical protein
MRRKSLWLTTAGMTAAMMAAPVPAAADAPPNAHNCAGAILSLNTPQDFHHGEEPARAVPQAMSDGRGDEITAFTTVTAGEDCR